MNRAERRLYELRPLGYRPRSLKDRTGELALAFLASMAFWAIIAALALRGGI